MAAGIDMSAGVLCVFLAPSLRPPSVPSDAIRTCAPVFFSDSLACKGYTVDPRQGGQGPKRKQGMCTGVQQQQLFSVACQI